MQDNQAPSGILEKGGSKLITSSFLLAWTGIAYLRGQCCKMAHDGWHGHDVDQEGPQEVVGKLSRHHRAAGEKNIARVLRGSERYHGLLKGFLTWTEPQLQLLCLTAVQEKKPLLRCLWRRKVETLPSRLSAKSEGVKRVENAFKGQEERSPVWQF